MIGYFVACAVMGAGIAIDVALASLARSGQLRTKAQACRWISRITATHVAFPMIGYYSAIQIERVAILRPFLGILAALLIAVLIFQVLRGFMGTPDPQLDDGRDASLEWGLVLAVSWDALLSGPAKAAQAVGWTEWQILLSFPLAGLVVAAAAWAATRAGQRLRTSMSQANLSRRRVLHLEYLGIVIELSIFSYFAFLAVLVFTIGRNESTLLSAAGALLTGLLIHLLTSRRIMAHLESQLEEI